MEDFRTPVPATLKGARVLTADEAADIWNKNGAVFIDVYPQAPKPPNLPAGTFWREPAHRSIEGAQWLPNVGYGALSATMERIFPPRLEALSKGKRDAAARLLLPQGLLDVVERGQARARVRLHATSCGSATGPTAGRSWATRSST